MWSCLLIIYARLVCKSIEATTTRTYILTTLVNPVALFSKRRVLVGAPHPENSRRSIMYLAVHGRANTLTFIDSNQYPIMHTPHILSVTRDCPPKARWFRRWTSDEYSFLAKGLLLLSLSQDLVRVRGSYKVEMWDVKYVSHTLRLWMLLEGE